MVDDMITADNNSICNDVTTHCNGGVFGATVLQELGGLDRDYGIRVYNTDAISSSLCRRYICPPSIHLQYLHPEIAHWLFYCKDFFTMLMLEMALLLLQ